MSRKPRKVEPRCVDCGGLGVLKPGRDVYPHRDDLWGLQFYVCTCGARVGCHKGTDLPLGYPCGPATARVRDKAHRVFDGLWRRKMERDGVSKGSARGAAYRWLSQELRIPFGDCHIGMMDRATAQRVVGLCTPIFNRTRPLLEDLTARSEEGP